MTRSQRVVRLAPYIRDLADRLCLKDWRVEVIEETVNSKHHNAEIGTICGYKDARIQLCEDFFAKGPAKQRSILCHELVHLHLAQLDDFLRPILGASQQTTYDLLREMAVDEIAHAVGAHLPMPAVEDDPSAGKRRR